MSRLAIVVPLVALLTSCASPSMIPTAAVAELAPTGKVRAAINFGNPILATKDPATGEARGVSVDLARELKHATLVRAPTSPEVVDFFVARKLDVAAGVKQQLEGDAKRLPGLRVLDGRFMVINQAMGTPRGRAAGARYLTDFVVTMTSSGFVAQALVRHGIEGAAVAP